MPEQSPDNVPVRSRSRSAQKRGSALISKRRLLTGLWSPTPFRFGVAVDGSWRFRVFRPRNVERLVGWEEVQTGVWQVIVDPPREQLPIAGPLVNFPEPRHNNASGGSHKTIRVAPIPDMASVIGFIAGTGVGPPFWRAASCYKSR